MCRWPAERSGACDESHDDRTACHHGSTCHQQLLHGGSKGRSEVLSGTWFWTYAGGWCGIYTGRCHESGILYLKSWHWCHGDLRKLHRQGSFPDGWVRQSCGTGYFRGNYRRTDYFSRLLYLWGGSDFRAQPDLYYFAEYFRKYALRPPVGKPVLPVHGVRSSVYSTGSIWKYHLLWYGTDRCQP